MDARALDDARRALVAPPVARAPCATPCGATRADIASDPTTVAPLVVSARAHPRLLSASMPTKFRDLPAERIGRAISVEADISGATLTRRATHHARPDHADHEKCFRTFSVTPRERRRAELPRLPPRVRRLGAISVPAIFPPRQPSPSRREAIRPSPRLTVPSPPFASNRAGKCPWADCSCGAGCKCGANCKCGSKRR